MNDGIPFVELKIESENHILFGVQMINELIILHDHSVVAFRDLVINVLLHSRCFQIDKLNFRFLEHHYFVIADVQSLSNFSVASDRLLDLHKIRIVKEVKNMDLFATWVQNFSGCNRVILDIRDQSQFFGVVDP
jgi:hypothetical protein